MIRSGQIAESRAAEFLEHYGYTIIDRNWKLPQCEIDIIAKKEERIYFVEVKYRKNAQQGTGIEYITKTKVHRMAFAAEMWVLRHKWSQDYQLAAIEISGEAYEITAFITDIAA